MFFKIGLWCFFIFSLKVDGSGNLSAYSSSYDLEVFQRLTGHRLSQVDANTYDSMTSEQRRSFIKVFFELSPETPHAKKGAQMFLNLEWATKKHVEPLCSSDQLRFLALNPSQGHAFKQSYKQIISWAKITQTHDKKKIFEALIRTDPTQFSRLTPCNSYEIKSYQDMLGFLQARETPWKHRSSIACSQALHFLDKIYYLATEEERIYLQNISQEDFSSLQEALFERCPKARALTRHGRKKKQAYTSLHKPFQKTLQGFMNQKELLDCSLYFKTSYGLVKHLFSLPSLEIRLNENYTLKRLRSLTYDTHMVLKDEDIRDFRSLGFHKQQQILNDFYDLTGCTPGQLRSRSEKFAQKACVLKTEKAQFMADFHPRYCHELFQHLLKMPPEDFADFKVVAFPARGWFFMPKMMEKFMALGELDPQSRRVFFNYVIDLLKNPRDPFYLGVRFYPVFNQMMNLFVDLKRSYKNDHALKTVYQGLKVIERYRYPDFFNSPFYVSGTVPPEWFYDYMVLLSRAFDHRNKSDMMLLSDASLKSMELAQLIPDPLMGEFRKAFYALPPKKFCGALDAYDALRTVPHGSILWLSSLSLAHKIVLENNQWVDFPLYMQVLLKDLQVHSKSKRALRIMTLETLPYEQLMEALNL
jgi:hypothetical protein